MNKRSRFVPIVVLAIVILGIAAIPLKIIGYGFLPQDDALRHVAKVISGKTWDEILVLRPEGRMDSHPGWHALLGIVYKTTNCSADDLVVFSVICLFLIFCLAPIFFLDRPESWPITLLFLTIFETIFVMRLFFGRPFLITISMVLVLCFIWPKLKDKKNSFMAVTLMTVFVSLSTWMHGSWYMLGLPVLAFLLAREWRATILLTCSIVAGVMLGALFTGHPYIFLRHNLDHMSLALGSHTLQRMLVGEFQPSTGEPIMILAVFGLIIWRRMRGTWNKKVLDNPVFMLALSGWVLGFLVKRFWLDWGVPALSVWMALEFQDGLKGILKFFSWKRLLAAIAISLTLYLAVTSDVNGRWTQTLTKEYLSLDDPEQAPWLPGPGGIIYSDDMSIFYDTFFKNPHASWRYILGFEPALMPPEDLAIYRKIQWNFRAYQAFEPWVKKMKYNDRLILRRPSGEHPQIPGLEWRYAATDTWIGRLSRNQK